MGVDSTDRCALAALLALAVITVAPAQDRQFWVLDGAGALRLTAPGDVTVGSIPLQGTPRVVRATAAGDAVVSDAGGPWLHLVSGTSVMVVEMPGGVDDAIPDGQGGAWAVVRAGAVSELHRVSETGRVESVATYSGVVTRIISARGGRLVFAMRVGGASSIVLADGAGGVIDDEPLSGSPFDLVLDNAGRLLVPGGESGWLTAFTVDGPGIVPAAVWPVATPLVAVAPFGGGDALLVAEGWPPVLRLIQPTGVPSPPVLTVAGVGAIECLPAGDVLVHDAALGVAWRVDRTGVATWTGPWSASWTWSDGAGAQHARAFPDADPDGDEFSNAAEIRIGTDPGFALSAPLALWRSGDVFRLRSAFAPMFYALVASDSVVAGSEPLLCAFSPLLLASTQPGVVFDLPWGASPWGEVDIAMMPGIPGDPWVSCAVFSLGFELSALRAARRISQW